MAGHGTPQGLAVVHRMAVVQAAPDPGAVDLGRDLREAGVGPALPIHLGNGGLVDVERHLDLVGPEEGPHRLGDGTHLEAVARGVLRMVDAEQRRPGGLRHGGCVAVTLGTGDRGAGTPGPVVVLGLEPGDAGVSCRGVRHRQEAGRVPHIEVLADGDLGQVAMPLHVGMLGPEVDDIGLFGGPHGTVLAAQGLHFLEVGDPPRRGERRRTRRPELRRVRERVRHDLAGLHVDRLGAASTLGHELADRRRNGAAGVGGGV